MLTKLGQNALPKWGSCAEERAVCRGLTRLYRVPTLHQAHARVQVDPEDSAGQMESPGTNSPEEAPVMQGPPEGSWGPRNKPPLDTLLTL